MIFVREYDSEGVRGDGCAGWFHAWLQTVISGCRRCNAMLRDNATSRHLIAPLICLAFTLGSTAQFSDAPEAAPSPARLSSAPSATIPWRRWARRHRRRDYVCSFVFIVLSSATASLRRAAGISSPALLVAIVLLTKSLRWHALCWLCWRENCLQRPNKVCCPRFPRAMFSFS